MSDDAAIRYQRMGESGSSEEDIVSFSGHRNDGLLDSGRFRVNKAATPQLHRRKKLVEPSDEGRVQQLGRRIDGVEAARRIMAERALNHDSNGRRRGGFTFQDDTNLRNVNRNKKLGGFAEMRRSQSLWSLGHRPDIEEEEEEQEEEQEVFENNGRPRRPESIEELRMRQKTHVKPNPLHRISSFSLPHQVSYHPMSKYQVSSDGQKMVLQLVLPQTGLDHGKHEPPITPDYIHYDLFKPRKGYNGVFESQPDLFPRHAVGPDIEYATNRGQGFSSSEIGIPDRSQLTVTSLGAVSSSLDEEDLPSTSPEEKLKMFRGYLTTILSCVYAVFIVTLGVVIYVSDVVLQNGTPIAESFSIYLVILGLIYFTFLYADIRRHMNKVKSRNAILLKDDNSIKDSSNITCHTAEGNIHLSIPLPSKLAEDPLPHHYCFNKGRHSGSFYLKVGAAGFCFGHLIHSGLMLGYQIVYLTADGEDFYNCASIATLVLDVLYPIYSFLQLFFIFKYSNVIINHCKELARFALMHCIASSLCFWIWTILRETLDSLNSYASSKSEYDEDDDSSEEDLLINSSHIINDAMALPLTRNQQIGATKLIQCLNNTSFWITSHCKPPAGLSIIANQFSPYLYPFTIEYSILVVGILFIIWQNVGKCKMDHGSKSACPASSVVGTQSNLVIHADCHAANKGLFAGLIVLVGSVVSIILFCIAMADNEFITMGLTVNAISELILLLLMTVTVILAYRKLTQLDINHHPISLLDDLLLFICIPAFFLYGIFSIVPAILKNNGLSITITLLQVIQVLLQTPFIIDGLRRCSNTRMLRLKKPGRELVTFLVVCNVAMWITETFEIKSHDRRDDRYDIYGKVLWTMLSHMTVPLTMFYRFHSSVCLVDIWKSAYERGE